MVRSVTSPIFLAYMFYFFYDRSQGNLAYYTTLHQSFRYPTDILSIILTGN